MADSDHHTPSSGAPGDRVSRRSPRPVATSARGPVHRPSLLRWLVLGAWVPAGSAALAALVAEETIVVAATLVVPMITILVLYARLSWNFSGRIRHALGAVVVTGLVLVPIMVLIAVALVPGQLTLTTLLLAPLAWVDQTVFGIPEAVRQTLMTLVFGALTGAVFMALITAFQHTLIPGRMPEVRGWVRAHLVGGAAAGAIIAAALLLESAREVAGARLVSLALLALSTTPHAWLTWGVWQRTVRAARD